MVSGRTCSITSNLQDEIDAEHILKGRDDYQLGQQEDPSERGIVNDAMEGPQGPTGKILMQSVSDILVQSAQSVKDFVSDNGSRTTESEDVEEKSLLQSVSERIARSAQSVKDVVNGSGETDLAEHGDEKSSTVTDRTLNGAGNVYGENGEDRTLLLSVSERIVQSARNVKNAVNGNGDSLETGCL